MPKVEPVNIDKAYEVFRQFNRMPRNQNSRRLFNKFLGRNEDAHPFMTIDNDEAAARVNWLLGPHAATMYKVWKLQHGE